MAKDFAFKSGGSDKPLRYKTSSTGATRAHVLVPAADGEKADVVFHGAGSHEDVQKMARRNHLKAEADPKDASVLHVTKVHGREVDKLLDHPDYGDKFELHEPGEYSVRKK